MSTVNLYDILNLTPDCNIKDIKNSYRKLAKEFHPDKPNGDEEMFELITQAYNTLINPDKKHDYDKLYNLLKNNNTSHLDMKAHSENYLRSQESKHNKEVKPTDIEIHKFNEELDRKHGYKREIEKTILTEEDSFKKIKDIQWAREQDDIESIQDMVFDKQVDISTFNAAFDMKYRKSNELIPHVGVPDAWNIMQNTSNFTPIDNYETLYTEDEPDVGTSNYSSIKLFDNEKKKRLTKHDIEKLSPVEYTKGHNYKEHYYGKTLEEKLQERELETQKFKDSSFNEFNTDQSCGGYGIFEKLNIDANNLSKLEDNKDLSNRYRLLEMKKSDLNK